MKGKFLFGLSAVVFLTGCTIRLPFWPAKTSSQETTSTTQTSQGGGTTTSQGGTSQGGNTSQGGGTSTYTTSLPDDVNNYYSSIGDKTGTELRNALNSLNNSKRKKTIGYKNHRDYYKYTEIVPDETPSGKMYGFYDNALVSNVWDNQATWNHEHVWPNSLGGGSVDGDIHMTRPASVKENSGRGNKYYAEGVYDPGHAVAEYRGVAARIIFYCAIANTNLSIIDANSGGSNQMGKLSDLLKWNLQYLPSNASNANIALKVEQNRNETIYSRSDLQGNRNPFIDHPEYACKIWGNTNATTKQICGM